MDEAARADLKVRFIKLIVLLNGILILIAIAALVFFKLPSTTAPALAAVLLAAAVGLFLYFLRMYRETRQWLEDEHRKRVRESSGEGGQSAGDDPGAEG